MSDEAKKEQYAVIFVGPDAVELAKRAFEEQLAPLGVTADRERVLSDSPAQQAYEFVVSLDPNEVIELGQALVANRPAKCDAALVKVAGRRKRLLISDMDSTIIQQECLDELSDFAGMKDKVSAITERAMAGELDFEAALTERVAMLKGLPLSALEACYQERISRMPGAQALVRTMAANGAHCLLVSGGFTFFTSRVAADVGFHGDRANGLVDDGAALTGEVVRPILGREAKLSALREVANGLGITPADALAIGDGANDLAMIEAAGLGIAYHAKPIVAAAAGAAITYSDLRAALYYQGYSDAEIVTGR